MEKTKNQILRCAINWTESKKYYGKYPTLEEAFIAGYQMAKSDYKKLLEVKEEPVSKFLDF